MNQIELHNRIDEYIAHGPGKAAWTAVKKITEIHLDVKKYFYTRADEKWFDLVRGDILNVAKTKASDPTKYSYQTPELDYLARVAEIIPQKVTKLILDTSISKENFNPEVVDRFLWISSKLPADQLKRVVVKIRDDQWIQLMAPFNRWVFEYQKMFETLAVAKDQDSILILAEAVLRTRSKDELAKINNGISTDNPFFLSDLSETDIFSLLASSDDKHLDAALRVATNALAGVIRTGDREDNVFEIGEIFHLFDVDFFSLELGKGRHYSHRDEVRELAAVVKTLVNRSIGKSCNDSKETRRIYEHIERLPDSRSMWRLRLYVWSLCPKVFKDELQTAFFKGLESREMLWPITGGAEYDHALKRCFDVVLSEEDRKAYIQRAFEILDVNEEHPYGYGIFASIQRHLSEPQKQRVEALYKMPLDPNYTPEPSVGHSYAGTIVSQSPKEADDVWGKPVPEIVQALETRLTPEQLQKIDGRKDFLKPVNAEGVADKMRSQMKERTSEYTANATLFFDRKLMDPHYTYSFFRGVDEIIRLHREKVSEINWQQIIALGVAITKEGQRESFDFTKREREHFDAWLAGWIGVHDGLGDVLQDYLRNDNGITEESFNKNREDLFKIICYLLTIPDPVPKDEQPETAGMTTTPPGGEKLVSDPFAIAINSVRGRAYQAFVMFMEWDGRKYAKDAKVKLSPDVLQEYKDLLARENTGAIFFMYGHYLPFFYFRDVKEVRKLLPQIFTSDSKKVHLYLAAWEGYLTRSLYREMFVQLQGEYERAIKNNPDSYPKRNYRADLDEALATHMALAYIHFEDFTLDSSLFKLFWSTPNQKRYQEFVSFIGRYVISKDHAKENLAENPEIKLSKLIDFWDWTLEYVNDPDVFAEYGFWMDTTGGLYDDVTALARRIQKTLKKSKGKVDWEIKLMDSLPTLAAAVPKDTLEILRLYLKPLDVSPRSRHFMHVDADLVNIFRTLHKNPETQDETYKLIDELLPLGNGVYWKLKEALTE